MRSDRASHRTTGQPCKDHGKNSSAASILNYYDTTGDYDAPRVTPAASA